MKGNINAQGLSSREAERRLAEYGKNVTDSGKKSSFLQKLLAQLGDLMIVILLAAAVLSFVIALYTGDAAELIEPLIIVGIVFANAILGALQEFKAEKSLLMLKKLTTPVTKVVRDGNVTVLDSELIVVGDVCVFDAGDIITADGRIASAEGLFVDQAAITGESVPVNKHDGDTVFGGSLVTHGRCLVTVTATGAKTELGKIADMLSDAARTQTPLQQRMKQLSKLIGMVCLAVCAVVFVIGLVKGFGARAAGESVTQVFADVLLTSVSLAVAAIPEGLPAVVTVVLAGGIEKMAAKNAVVKRLTAVEALGSASVICSDKTGTLTQNKMTLTGIFDGKAFCAAEGLTKDNLLLRAFAWCSDAVKNSDGAWLGDPTEIAVARLVASDENVTRLFELPFDSQRKLMTTVVECDGAYYAVTKGNPECMTDEHGVFMPQYKLYSCKGLRVLALSLRKVSHDFPRSQALEKRLPISALFVISDPPRAEAAQAVEVCRQAGIRPIMITGDSVQTAVEIARELCIMQQCDLVLSGERLAQTSVEELAEIVDRVAVYARVTPSDKLKIVRAWQSKGAVVAMTGDGVNDAPALKHADIGCAMGSGTEVAKNAADIILTDDNFATVVDAVSLGRSVYQNIKKTVNYLLTCNIGEVLFVFFALLLWDASPLAAMQLLWINLVTDGLPGLALGLYRQERDVMRCPPRLSNEGFFSNGGGRRVFEGGVLFALATLTSFACGARVGLSEASTMAYLTLSTSQLVFVLEMRSEHGAFDRGITPFMLVSLAVSAVLVWSVALVPPLMSLLELVRLSAWQYLLAVALSLLPVAFYRLRQPLAALIGGKSALECP